MPAPGPTAQRPSTNVCGWTKEGKLQNALTWSAGSLVFQEAQLLLAEGWLKLWASPRTFFIRHKGLFLSCILLICLSTETYYLLDFCNSSAPKAQCAMQRTPRQQKGRPEQWSPVWEAERKEMERKDRSSRPGRSGDRRTLPPEKWQPGPVHRSSSQSWAQPSPYPCPRLFDSLAGKILWETTWKVKSIL